MGLFDSMAQGLFGSLGGGLISGGLGAISSIFSNNAQKKENERNREFAEYMYDRQYDNSIKVWNMQNKYDLPSAQKQRLIDAGLNPDLMYSGHGVSPSPNLQAAVAGSPSSGSLPGYGGMSEAFNQGRLIDAQIRNIDADTQKKKVETEGQGYTNIMLMADSEVAEAMAQGRLTLQGLEISFKEESNPLMIKRLKFDIAALQTSIDQMNQNIDESAQRVANMKQDEISKILDNYLKENGLEYQLRILAAHCNIAETEAKYAVERICSEIAVNKSQARLNNANASNAELEFKIGDKLFRLRNDAGYYTSLVNAETAEADARNTTAERVGYRDASYLGNSTTSKVLRAADCLFNLIGGVFGASVSISSSSSSVNSTVIPRGSGRGGR